MSKKYQNADTTIAGDLGASGSSIVVKSGEGALFPSDGFPYQVTLEHYEGSVVTKREILTISARATDAFTISARASQTCVQDESAATKTRTANALSFVSGDRMYMSIGEEDWNNLEDEVNINIPADIEQAKDDIKKEIQKQTVVYGSSSTGSDDYAITLDPIPDALIDGMTLRFLADVGNTGAATLNVNGLGAKTIKKKNDQDLIDGDIEANQIVTVVYNATDDVFEMVSQVASVVNVVVENLQKSFTAGEDINSGDIVRFGYGIKVYDYDSTYTNEQRYGYNTTDAQIIQSFTPTEDTKLMNFTYWDRNDDNTGGGAWRYSYCSMYSDLACTNELLNFGYQSNSGSTAVRLTHDGKGYQLQAGVTYYFRIWTTNVSTSYYHFIRWNNGNPHSGGTAYKRDSSGNTTALSGDLQFAINFGYNDEYLNKVYKTDASQKHKLAYRGIAKSTVLADENVIVDMSGVSNSQTGLTPGAEYYLSDTPGEISTTEGTNKVLFGNAVTSEEIYIYPISEFLGQGLIGEELTVYRVDQGSTGTVYTTVFYTTKNTLVTCTGYYENNGSCWTRLEVSDDGSSWSTYYTHPEDGTYQKYTRSVSFLLPAGKYIRGACNTSNSSYDVWVEIACQY